jgi:Glucose / Sorbosone dehydrogenase
VKRVVAAVALVLVLAVPAAARAALLQPIGQFDEPIYVTSPAGNADRLFVVERDGQIAQVQNGTSSVFADISDRVTTAGEGGLLSIALAPDFGSSGRLYLFYTGKEKVPGEIHVAEMRASGDTAQDSSLRNLLTILHPGDNNHYGGQLQIGPEGLLYISTGDGGGENDAHENAQNVSRPLGKLLRIDPNPSGLLPYTVPAGNPFAGSGTPANLVWAYGLRNPFRFSFDSLTGDLAIGDVGQGAREEVDFAPAPGLRAGANYGWNCREGLIAGPEGDPECASPLSPFVDPIFDYPHSDPGGGGAFGLAIIGGYVVRDRSLGDLYGRYLYGDWSTGGLRSFSISAPFATDRTEALNVTDLESFGEDACNRLYAVSGGGWVYRIANPEPAACANTTPRAVSFAGIHAQRRKVRRNRRALITAWVSPCAGRRGQPIRLLRGGRPVATRRLDRACTARFRPRIRRRVSFRTSIAADGTYQAAISRRLKMKLDHRKPAKRKPRR